MHEGLLTDTWVIPPKLNHCKDNDHIEAAPCNLFSVVILSPIYSTVFQEHLQLGRAGGHDGWWVTSLPVWGRFGTFRRYSFGGASLSLSGQALRFHSLPHFQLTLCFMLAVKMRSVSFLPWCLLPCLSFLASSEGAPLNP